MIDDWWWKLGWSWVFDEHGVYLIFHLNRKLTSRLGSSCEAEDRLRMIDVDIKWWSHEMHDYEDAVYEHTHDAVHRGVAVESLGCVDCDDITDPALFG